MTFLELLKYISMRGSLKDRCPGIKFVWKSEEKTPF